MNNTLHIIQYSGFACAQITNLILLLLIIKKAKRLFGSYRHVMTIFTVYSILYTWIEIISLPLMHVHGSMFIMMVDSFLRFEPTIGYHILCLYCASYSFCISLLATQFFYRYIVVCKPDYLGKLNGWRLSIIFFPGMFFFFAWYSFVFFGMEKTDEKTEYARKTILEVYQEDTEKLAFIALQFWDKDSNGKNHLRIWDWLSYLGCLSIIGTCFSTILFCAYKIYIKLKSGQVIMSAKTKALNNDLLVTLVFQTVLPFCLMYSVVGIILTLPIFEVDIGRKANFPGSAAGVYPALEPLIAMYFIKDFRNALSCKSKIGASVSNNIPMKDVKCNSQRSSIAFINKSLA